MKAAFGLLILAVAVAVAFADVETCTAVSNCSEAMKTKCHEMSELLKESEGGQKLVVACKNGICMCNMADERPENKSVAEHVEEP